MAETSKIGRPRKDPQELRSDRLPDIRVTAAERLFIETEAAAAGLSVSEFMRRRALGGKIIAKPTAADDALLVALNRAGVNLNQIARAVNSGRDLPAHFAAALAEVRAAVALVAGYGS